MRQERLVALLWLPIWMFTREDEQWPKVKMAALPARLCQTSTKYENKVRQIFRATLIVELATISLLIEAGMTTTEAAIQRIEQIQDALSETFRSNEVSQRVARVIHLLRDQDNKHSTV
jgi:hypothetical protein